MRRTIRARTNSEYSIIRFRSRPRGGQVEAATTLTQGVTKPGFKLSDDLDGRQIDVMGDDGVVHEVKSGKEELTKREVAQMEDYDKMVRGALAVDMGGGKKTVVKKVKYTFTSLDGAKANRANMELALRDFPKRVVFEVISPNGTLEQIDSLAALNKSSWL